MSHQNQLKGLSVLLAITFLASALIVDATADPLPGRDLLKFSQQPMIITGVNDANGLLGKYYGHDELSTAYGFQNTANQIKSYDGRFMADDFADNLSSPVVHVKWWGSYLNHSDNSTFSHDKFLISFESDTPSDPSVPGSFSHPDQPLLSQVVRQVPIGFNVPGSGTYTERLIRGPDPILGESLYEYNAELHLDKPFPEQKDTVYWLKIVNMVDLPAGFPTFDPYNPQSSPFVVPQWGWHNRDYTIQDTLASPVVIPGEKQVGPINGTPVWHFQDDAIQGNVRIDPNGPGGLRMPDVFQPVTSMLPQRYLDGIDGPASFIAGQLGIGAYSKDLAFELYTVPEPTTCLLLSVGLAGVLLQRRRSQNA